MQATNYPRASYRADRVISVITLIKYMYNPFRGKTPEK